MAEWQTRTVQVRVSERTWRFNSSLAHHDGWSSDYLKHRLTRASALVGGGLSWTRMAFRGLSFPTYSPRISHDILGVGNVGGAAQSPPDAPLARYVA